MQSTGETVDRGEISATAQETRFFICAGFNFFLNALDNKLIGSAELCSPSNTGVAIS